MANPRCAIDRRIARRPACATLAWVVLAGAAAGLPGQAGAAQPASPPPVVTVAVVQKGNIATTHSFIGRVIAIQSVQIVPRVTAFVEDVPVTQGSNVKAGQVLYELQKTQYQAALQSAEAQLHSAQAELRNDEVAYTRAERLNHQGFEAQATLDSAVATRDQAKAAVESAQAAVTLAALNLSYCTIRAPIDGRIGAVNVTKGNLVTPSTPAMATINQLDPIRVVFSVAAKDLVRAERKTGHSQSEIARNLSVHLQLPDGSAYPEPGKIAFVGNSVDQQTGTVSIYADFANAQRLLLPDMFVTVDVQDSKPVERILVPVAAVQTDQNGSFVLIVGADGKVVQQAVTIGAQIAQNFVVTKGLSAGQRVIVAGLQKVQPHEVVKAIEADPPPAKVNATAKPGPAIGAARPGGND